VESQITPTTTLCLTVGTCMSIVTTAIIIVLAVDKTTAASAGRHSWLIPHKGGCPIARPKVRDMKPRNIKAMRNQIESS